ncbi:Druantia anti-phage system protein DruA [Actinoplanes utahensis]|uniref:Druantia anti-phage system protein DruA n=1 Tax=Actinoplanes utahensis TaxID=1869 RepID=UPI00137879C5|nr:Druantia anti-phage system protein DruA [Actinoplanes utahensis]
MGFSVNNGRLVAPNFEDKERLRKLHSEAVDFQRAKSAGALRTHEDLFLRKMARGETIDVQRIDPILVPVIDRRSFEGLLWRWCSLHWSVPVSAGYGRRLRFLVMDRGHANKVMGLIGLGDPVFALRARDNWLGWTAEQRRERLTNVMDAFVLGAVPPYSNLLGGKLVALLATSLEVRQAFELRYSHRQTLITQRDPNAQLALVTTSSALGRSSIYNRLTRPDGTLAFLPTGYTEGTGDFHLSGSIYDELAQLAAAANPQKASHAHARWKESGARNRREVIQRALHTLGLDGRQLRVHGVRRQVFLAPLMANVSDHLIKGVDAQWITSSVSEASSYWLKRWATPRAARADSWRDFQPSDWRLYKQ